MKTWSNEAFAGYLAGMLDGEGCIELHTTVSVRIRIANTIKPTLDAILERLRFGRVIEYRGREERGFKRLWCFEVSNCRDVKALFEICGPFVHMKVDQMDRALVIVDRVLSEGGRIDARNRNIMAALATGETGKSIAGRFAVSEQLVSRIKRGHTWSTVISGHRARKLARRNPREADQVFRLHGEP